MPYGFLKKIDIKDDLAINSDEKGNCFLFLRRKISK